MPLGLQETSAARWDSLYFGAAGDRNRHVVARVRPDGGTHVRLEAWGTDGRTKYDVTRKPTALPLKLRAGEEAGSDAR